MRAFFAVHDRHGKMVGLTTMPPADALPPEDVSQLDDTPQPGDVAQESRAEAAGELEPAGTHPTLKAVRPGERRPLAELFGSHKPAASPEGDTAASVGAWWRQPLALAVLAVLAILALLALLNPAASPSIQQQEATTLPPSMSATPHAAVSLRLARAVIAYDAPEGQPLGAIEPGRGFVLLESRTIWQRLDVDRSGVVWVRTWELEGTAPPTATPLPTPTAEPTSLPAPLAPSNRASIVPPPPPVYRAPLVPAPPPPTACGENTYGRVCSDNPALIDQGLTEIAATAQAGAP